MTSLASTRHLLAPGIAVSLALTATSCSREAPPVDDGPDVVIDVLEPGQEPRVDLALQVTVGHRETSKMVLRQRVLVDAEAVTLPKTTLTWTTEVTEVTDDEVSIVTTYDRPSVGDGDPETRQRVEASLTAFDGLEVHTTTTRQGVLLDSEVQATDGQSASLGPAVAAIEAQAASLAVPVPDEPIGVGGSWVVRDTSEDGGVTIRRESVYTVESVAPTGAYAVTTTLLEEFVPGRVPGGELLDGYGTAVGRIEGDPGLIGPASSSSESNSSQHTLVEGRTTFNGSGLSLKVSTRAG